MNNKYEIFVKEHLEKMKELQNKHPEHHSLIVNAFGGAGAGKSTACLHIVEALKKKDFVAEYVTEYAKDLVWDENWNLLDGSQEHQFEILKEQLHRMDRLLGKVDFIVTDSPILLNSVYNKELTPDYQKMLTQLNGQYRCFNFVVERNTQKFEKEGRIHSLQESIQKDREIKSLLQENQLYYGTYHHGNLDVIVQNVLKTQNNIYIQDIKEDFALER